MSARKRMSRFSLVLSIIGSALALSSVSAFAAGAPVVVSESVAGVGFSGATLKAKINPQEVATTYHFEYGATTTYGTSVPIPDADIGAAGEAVSVTQSISGLVAGTTYHYRVVASNAEGVSEGKDLLFRTFPVEAARVDSCDNALLRQAQFSTFLPDCRAYELVSPPDKEGANVAAIASGGTTGSVDGNAIRYMSVTGYGDVSGMESRGAEYASARTSGGWTSHSINPGQESRLGGLFISPQYEAFSSDLSKGVFFGYSSIVTGHPNVEHNANLYLRTDLLDGPPGHYELLSDAFAPLPPLSESDAINESQGLGFADASEDLSHVLFESDYNLTPEASGLNPELPKAYEWVNGTVKLVGILPSGEPAETSTPGRGAARSISKFLQPQRSLNTISSDGSRVVFTGPPLSATVQTESKIPQLGAAQGNIYMRIDELETIQLNVSERATLDPEGRQPAIFEGATRDGTKVLFATSELLTDNALTDTGRNLYMYDLNAPAGKHLTLISVNMSCGCAGGGENTPVDAISEDGKFVYFLSETRLVEDQPPPIEGELYVWHDGVVRAVAAHLYADPRWGETGIYAARGDQELFRTTPDGRTAVFASVAESTAMLAGVSPPANVNQDSAESGLTDKMFVYSYDTNKLVCASCSPSGATPENNASFEEYADGGAGIHHGGNTTEYLTRPLDGDGRRVFFDTAEALAPQDTNGKVDVYEFDTQANEVNLISSGLCGCDSRFVEASADGSNVFFTTRQKLVRADFDDSSDLYDGRVGGGIVSQNKAPVAPCEGDDCQGSAKAAPVFSLPASSTFVGIGNRGSRLTSKVVPKSKRLTNAQKLASALRLCEKRPRRKRPACRTLARRKYAAKPSARHASRRPGR